MRGRTPFAETGFGEAMSRFGDIFGFEPGDYFGGDKPRPKSPLEQDMERAEQAAMVRHAEQIEAQGPTETLESLASGSRQVVPLTRLRLWARRILRSRPDKPANDNH